MIVVRPYICFVFQRAEFSNTYLIGAARSTLIFALKIHTAFADFRRVDVFGASDSP